MGVSFAFRVYTFYISMVADQANSAWLLLFRLVSVDLNICTALKKSFLFM